MHLCGPILLAAALLLTGCPGPVATTPSLDEVRGTLQTDFNSADTNQDSSLSLEEAQAAAEGMSATQFDTLDTNQDGALSATEIGLVEGGEGEGEGEPDGVVQYTYAVLDSFPHDTDAFTQGLVYDDGVLYESTGIWGKSSVRRVDLDSGTVQQQTDLASSYFGEGIVLWQDTLIQLTWQSRKGFVYDKDTFEQTGDFTYASEGWGITHNGAELIMSDGTSTLRFLNPDTFAVTREITVTDEGAPVTRLNELEYIHGEIWANVWQTDTIARIDPADGRVAGWLDLTGLLTPSQAGTANVLNGIAFDSVNDRILVTGKLWPLMFQIEVTPIP